MARIDRVEELIRREVITVIYRQMDAAKIGFITITKVEVAKDFSVANVYFSQIGTEDEKKKTRRFLGAAAGFVRGEIGKVIRLKHIPRVRFIYDETIEKTAALIARINEITKEDAA